MLTLLLGRAKSGKTAMIMDEIASLVGKREKNIVLLVPEQYSHEAERELLRRCGDSLSLYAEVLSFTRLCARVEAEVGRRPGTLLDKGGRLLCMSLALDAVGSRLKLYGAARHQSELQDSLLHTIDELRAACLGPQQLLESALSHDDTLGDKLQDLALIQEAYEAVLGQSRLDPTERLDHLYETIGRSSLAGGHVYLDGFTDFTRQESRVIEALLRNGADVSVSFSCESFEESHEIFEASRRAALSLRRMAEGLGLACRVITREKEAEGPMALVERELFSFSSLSADALGCVHLHSAPSLAAECEAAAAHCLALVREGDCRWRDIALCVRGYEDYRGILEHTFSRYGIPLYSAVKNDLASHPLLRLIRGAFDVVNGGWDYEDIFTYLKSGLAGLNTAECDRLENYAFLWSLHGSAWTRGEDWRLHPEGYNAVYNDKTWEVLGEINALRRRVSEPLLAFAAVGKAAATALEQAQALSALFDVLSLPKTLSRRAAELDQLGLTRHSAEYQQLWDIVVNALEQCGAILGDMPMNNEQFGKLFLLVLSKYDVGTIPLSLDKVSAGDMDRSRRRNIRHLLVLGCDGERIPLISSGSGIFSDDDREALLLHGIDMGNSAADRLCHEFALIYHCMSLPSQSLYLSYSNGGENKALPAFVMTRLSALFSLPIVPVDLDQARLSAGEPAFDLAARHLGGDPGAAGKSAVDYFIARGEEERLQQLRAAASLTRGQLSRQAVQSLYGSKLRLSATRIDKFASCRFAYYLQYGLKAKPRQAAAFAPPERGTFMHYVLEHVAGDIKAQGGFSSVSDEEVEALCQRYVDEYIHEQLNDFREKTPRFIYLFHRLSHSVRRVVLDMVHELQNSQFQPLNFELDFGDETIVSPLEMGEGEDKMILTGIADRVDGWLHDGKLYLRVVDYKTGRKSFQLSDVLYGKDLQMLLYLFTLQEQGQRLYGHPVEPAGVLYMPARDLPQSVSLVPEEEEITAAKAKARERKGLILGDEEVLQAMDATPERRYLPVTVTKSGKLSSKSLASAEQFGALSRHIHALLCAMAAELHAGSITADPYFRSQNDSACRLCDYRSACHFDEGRDVPRYLKPLTPQQVWELIEKGEES